MSDKSLFVSRAQHGEIQQMKLRNDTRVYAFVQPDQTTWVAGTRVGIEQYRTSAYNESGDNGWDITDQLTQDCIVAANRVSEWEKIRRFGREWNFVANK